VPQHENIRGGEYSQSHLTQRSAGFMPCSRHLQKSAPVPIRQKSGVTRVHRHARKEWNVDPPTRKSIYQWDKTLRETGSLVSHAGKHHKQHVTEVTVDRARESFCRNPR
jgi:hypothetical protein